MPKAAKKEILDVRRQTAMVFQHYNLFANKTVLENVTQGLITVQKISAAEAKQKGEYYLEKVGLADKRNSYPIQLSGGQQQRVLLARALCATRKMLLLDEPVSGLDPKVTAEMYALIAELNRNDGITVIMISHDITAAVKYASHLLHIGDTVFFGTKAEYLRSPQGRLFAAEKGGDEQ